ncbi:PEP-CTERM sorting domain-containing protein [Verrucomicrobiaceae bacterium N1E253]|uniref:PEP-CTERM sorting domain-containing protein n=1 Tax=Oceaniferula marina TaxID=2748318 RepID=A0A851GFH8_9BACT|nr:PEP-CTERM sorting domain-containing protein [Oceaniferula marina]NWK54511.1 PEP-CTERM sorting domain-containing protein [Oceaniferula marina]
MKSTFIATISVLAASAISATAALTATNVNAADNAGNSYFGFAVDLSSNVVTLSETPAPATFEIDTLELTGRPSGGTYGAMKIAVYEFAGDGTVGAFVGLSDAQTLAAATAVEFNFSGVTVNTSGTYQYLFVGDSTSEADLDTEGFAGYNANAVSSSLSMSPNGSLPSGSGTYKNSTLNDWEGSFLPEFTFTAVPEPSSISLLGLGLLSLCLRRRK